MADDGQVDRDANLKRGIRVEIASLVYNVLEVVVSVTAGLLTGSAALVSWGLDSTVEATSAGTLIWRLRGEAKGADRRTVLHRKKVALTVVACAFSIVVAAILYEAVSAFVSQEAQASTGGASRFCSCRCWSTPSSRLGKVPLRQAARVARPEIRRQGHDDLPVPDGGGPDRDRPDAMARLVVGRSRGSAADRLPYVAWEGIEATKDAWSVDPDDAKATA